jgi:nucleoside-diphosphate-sugar epimerase
MKHTILGAGGSIGNSLTVELLKSGQDVRLVSRKGNSVTGTESFKADITSYSETVDSVRGSDIVYLCAGLPYDSKVWAELWPKVMQNTIDACKKANARLIFFDNVYMYGKVDGPMTENTMYNPCSKKGEIRARIATHLQDEIRKRNITASIARSADFYGPYATGTSMLYILVIDKLMKGKSAQWMADVSKPHSFSYTIDCAKGLKILSENEASFNQVWHLPTCNPAIDGKTFIELSAKELGVAPKYSVLAKWMVKMFGYVNKTVGELHEMMYQNEFSYHFDSSKFNEAFHYKPVSYEQGIHETIEFLKNTIEKK